MRDIDRGLLFKRFARGSLVLALVGSSLACRPISADTVQIATPTSVAPILPPEIQSEINTLEEEKKNSKLRRPDDAIEDLRRDPRRSIPTVTPRVPVI